MSIEHSKEIENSSSTTWDSTRLKLLSNDYRKNLLIVNASTKYYNPRWLLKMSGIPCYVPFRRDLKRSPSPRTPIDLWTPCRVRVAYIASRITSDISRVYATSGCGTPAWFWEHCTVWQRWLFSVYDIYCKAYSRNIFYFVHVTINTIKVKKITELKDRQNF